MRRLSLTAMPEARGRRASMSGKATPSRSTRSLRSTFGNFSMMSSASTQSSGSLTSLNTLSSSFLGEEDEEDEDGCSQQGWMYWKREHDCWLKVYARLRNELLWLSKGADDVVALVQIAVRSVERSAIGGLQARGPSGECMELFAYEREHTGVWVEALEVAASLTRSYERAVAAAQPDGVAPRPSLPRRQQKEVDQIYTGTLVIYEKERTTTPWKKFWSPKRLRDACRRRLEKFVDGLEHR